MLIPQECHKPAFQIDGPIMQTAYAAVPQRVLAPNKSGGTKQHEEKSHKRKRKFRFCADDEAEISDDARAQEEEFSDGFDSLLAGLVDNF